MEFKNTLYEKIDGKAIITINCPAVLKPSKILAR